MALRKKSVEPEAPGGAPLAQVIDLPIMPTEFALGQLTTPGGAYAVITLSTMLMSGTFVLDRGQAIRAAAEIMKLAEKMPKDKRIEVPGDYSASGLVLPS